jgi:hypothetical protein
MPLGRRLKGSIKGEDNGEAIYVEIYTYFM